MRFWDIVMTAATQPQGAGGPAPDALAVALAALEASGKLVSAWFLPSATPAQYLTLVGANVNLWTAAYGTQKVDLAVEVAAPQWDATLFSNKGGVTFNGTTQRLLGTGNVVNWPDASTDLYMGVAAASIPSLAVRRALSYGDAAPRMRAIGNSTGPVIVAIAGTTNITGSGSLTGSHSIGCFFDIGGNSQAYLDGVADGVAVSTPSASLSPTIVRMGASAVASASQFFQGTLVGGFVLGPTANLIDFTNLLALYQARAS